MHSIYHDEQQRLAAVHALQWLETAKNENFQRICRLAATFFKVPTALISLVEKDRQWFPGSVGFAADETPIDQSFCRHGLTQPGVLVVPDARLDERFSRNPLVTAKGGIRFYAGAPLRDRNGLALGRLCIIDSEPHPLTAQELSALEDFAEMVMVQIEQCQLMRYRDPLSGLPNLSQFLIDTRGLPANSNTARLVIVIRIQDSQCSTPASLDDCISAGQERRRAMAIRLRHQLDGIAETYQVTEQDLCAVLSCKIERKQELFRAVIALISDPDSQCTTRIGVASCEQGTMTSAELLRKATHAVEVASRRQSDWAVYDEAQDSAQRRAFTLLSDFTAAMDDGGLYLDYQPRFSLQDGRLLSAEALIRWQHPVLGNISPAEFIPLIEGAGQISIVTRWVINKALAELAGWSSQETRLAINLSAMDFESLDIALTLKTACKRHGIAPSRLEVEITEGEWIRANPLVISQLSAVRELGVDVAIDDFGTGYSNFAYLHEIPANVLKLDRSLVTDLEHKPRNRIIARSVFKLAHELGYRTVAEGIETFRCLSLVREYGCHEAQGYFLSRPLPLAYYTRPSDNIALSFNPCKPAPEPAPMATAVKA
ncbi:sensor domain-containing phosphodiesterase [Pseudomonas huanghezhanensis]|uniref:sensor domain-containing phosphodiesterase n=1 Tax=Pseudomonas huanghezhanensis TaxID=3002903 RepID=UPI002285F38E|nr:EAL domain-containing protein [Pseudomonas sp. BSw22131]